MKEEHLLLLSGIWKFINQVVLIDYIIIIQEAKNSELKQRHGYGVASSSGLIGVQMQGALTIFAVNLKRIVKLLNEK
ncbi:MAG: hypothetical protein IIT46_05790 [Lachnospiraceae bacterium]|nr:hypothetical protein [Lachnospiraceae bacterium]